MLLARGLGDFGCVYISVKFHTVVDDQQIEDEAPTPVVNTTNFSFLLDLSLSSGLNVPIMHMIMMYLIQY